MAIKKAATKTFNIQGRVWAEVGIGIQADTLADAIEVSKGLKLTDFITVEGDHNDSGHRVTGVFESYTEPRI
jgi:hypothetical protein